MKDYNFAEEVKSVLVEMAIDDSLPMDMSSLDIHGVFEKAKENIRNERLGRLAKFVSMDCDLDETLKALESANDNDNAGHIEGVQMAEDFEFTFTVKDLLERIG
jgi:hypothetical protein